MMQLTKGETIIMAERQLEGMLKEYNFCIDILRGKFDVRRHFSHLLVPLVFVNYRFDEDEQYYFDEAQRETGISKASFIKKRIETEREHARQLYLKKVAEYENVPQKCNDLKKRIDEGCEIIKNAKKKYKVSYFKAKYIGQRMYSPSFICSLEIGQAIQKGIASGLGIPNNEYISYIDQLKFEKV